VQPGLTQIVTFPPDGSGSGLSLAHIGHMSPARYSYATPGGCDQLSATFLAPARRRTEALNPGRLVYAYRGGSVVWQGTLDEPSPTDQGWTINAHGAGSWGNDYRAIYSVNWGTGVFNDAVDQAISRGLNWVRTTNIGALSGIWTGQKVDSGSQSITDLLNLACTKGGLTWQVTTRARGNVLGVFSLPTSANRLLISTQPVGQSIASGPNKVWARYQNTSDTKKAKATYALTSSSQPNVIARQGLREDFTDVSSAGVQSSGAVQTMLSNTLKRFTRAGFSDAFTVKHGELTNMGGTPVDLGVYYADATGGGMVCKVLLTDFAFGGEVTKGPITFLVGHYEWDDDARIATITPFESMRHDFGSLLQVAVDAMPHRRHHATHKKKKGR
jgi:hypothetical protein